MRFEIVSAPVERRVQDTIQSQADLAFETISTFLHAINTKTSERMNITFYAFSDPIYMFNIYTEIMSLLAPHSLPGGLLIGACVFRVLHAMVVHKLARNAQRRTKSQ
jgi:hypothetical protein